LANELKNKKILIIEDDVTFANELKKQYEFDGFEVLIVDTTAEAEKIIPTFKPDGISLDIQLKDGVYGVNIITKLTLKTLIPYIPKIVVVSSYLSPSMIDTLNGYGVLFYDKIQLDERYSIVSETFLFFFLQQNIITNISADDVNKQLTKQIDERLNFYKLDSKSVGYSRIKKGILAAVKVGDHVNLAEVYKEDGDYNTVSTSIKKSIKDAYTKSNANFSIFDKQPPSPKEFIRHVAREINDLEA